MSDAVVRRKIKRLARAVVALPAMVSLVASLAPAAFASWGPPKAVPGPEHRGRVIDTAPEPPVDDRDRDRIVRMQDLA